MSGDELHKDDTSKDYVGTLTKETIDKVEESLAELIKEMRAGRAGAVAVIGIHADDIFKAKVLLTCPGGLKRRIAMTAIAALAARNVCNCGDPTCPVFMPFTAVGQIAQNYVEGVPCAVIGVPAGDDEGGETQPKAKPN